MVEGRDAPGRVAAGSLDFHHIGAKIRQQLGAVRPGNVVGKVQYLDPLKGSLGHYFSWVDAALTLRIGQLQ